MKITCSDGAVVNLGIHHEKDVEIPRYPGVKCRATVMFLHCDAKGIHLEERVTCSPEDNFSKSMGRELVRDIFMPQFRGMRVSEVLEAYHYWPEDQFDIDHNYDIEDLEAMGANTIIGVRKEGKRLVAYPEMDPLADLFSRDDRRKIYAVLYPEHNFSHLGYVGGPKAPRCVGPDMSGCHMVDPDDVIEPERIRDMVREVSQRKAQQPVQV